ncbi:hypothetical protein CBL_08618 [Carabus blaptoides fortunei]
MKSKLRSVDRCYDQGGYNEHEICYANIFISWGQLINETIPKTTWKGRLDDVLEEQCSFGQAVEIYHVPNSTLYTKYRGLHGDKLGRSPVLSPEITKRNNKNIKRCRADLNIELLMEYFSHLEETIAGIPPEKKLNYDETNMTDDPGKTKVIVGRGCKQPHRLKGNNITILNPGKFNRKTEDEIKNIFQETHGSKLSGHYRFHKTYSKIKLTYY